MTQAVHQLVAELGATPLIGFAGAPFTVASYLVEGGPSKDHARTKALMFGAPRVWEALMRKIAGIAAAYLRVQVAAGASAVQLFDSWAGTLARADYERSVLPHSASVLAAVGGSRAADPLRGRHRRDPRPDGVAGRRRGRGGLAGAAAMRAYAAVGGRVVQGNLDPTLVFAPTEVLTARAEEVLEAGAAAPGHIFNLGHGVIPSTDPDQLARLTDFVHEHSGR